MSKRSAFTLLEVLLAVSISSFIMFGMVQLYTGIVRYVERTRAIIHVNRKVCLFFNQLERDLGTAYAPFLAKQEKGGEKAPQDKNQPQDQQDQQKAPKTVAEEAEKKEAEKAKEQRKKFFVATIDENAEIVRIDKKKVELCKMISFICTNPLYIYGERQQKLVRVVYQLVKDKAKSTRDNTCYALVRKETTDLLNVYAKAEEPVGGRVKNPVKSYVIAENVKGLYVEFSALKEKKKDEKGVELKDQKAEEIHTFLWGDKKETQGVVPQKVQVWIDLWDEKIQNSTRLDMLFAVLAYPTVDEEESKKKEQEEKQKQEKGPDLQGAQQQGQQGAGQQGAQQQPATPPVGG